MWISDRRLRRKFCLPSMTIGALVYSNQPWGWGGWGWGWGGRSIYYNHGPWGGVWVGGYRPPVIWYHPLPVYYAGHPGYGAIGTIIRHTIGHHTRAAHRSTTRRDTIPETTAITRL